MLVEVELEVEPLPPELLPASVAIVIVDEDALPPSGVVAETELESFGEPADVAESDVAAVESAVVVAIVLPSVDVAVWAAAMLSSTNAQSMERRRYCILIKRVCRSGSDSTRLDRTTSLCPWAPGSNIRHSAFTTTRLLH